MRSPTEPETQLAASEPVLERRLKHHALAARTVAVTYRAAINSAQREMGRQERTELAERWQRWALETLDGYGDEVRDLATSASDRSEGESAALDECRQAMDEAYTIVRSTPP